MTMLYAVCNKIPFELTNDFNIPPKFILRLQFSSIIWEWEKIEYDSSQKIKSFILEKLILVGNNYCFMAGCQFLKKNALVILLLFAQNFIPGSEVIDEPCNDTK